MSRVTLIDKLQPGMRMLDWGLAFASFFYGLYEQSWLWIGAGILGFGLAWYNPSKRLRLWFATFIKPRER